MNEPRIQSGIPEDLLSLIVFSFFPTSDRYFMPFGGCYKLDSQYLKQENNIEYIFSGSGPEYLWLPLIIDKNSVKHTTLMPDDDQMVNFNWFRKFYDSMSLEIDKKCQVFCKIRHGVPVESITDTDTKRLVDGPYLNSAKINEEFRENLLKMWATHKREHLTQSFEKDHESPPLATTYTVISGTDPHSVCIEDIFCIPIKLNVEIKEKLLKRLHEDRWPLSSVKNLNKLLEKRVYAVPKPDKDSDFGDLRWRLSFSVIEIELARSLTETQRRCYKVLKAIIKYDINLDLTEGEKFPSYYLKTLMFWLCETTPQSLWKVENLGKGWLYLLNIVIESLKKKNLPMYFVPSYNLLDGKPSSTIDCWLERFEQIRQKPLETFSKFWSMYLVFYQNEYWGNDLYMILDSLNKTYNDIAEMKPFISREIYEEQLDKYEHLMKNVNSNTLILKMVTSKYLLSIYHLVDFLTFMELHFQTEELVNISHATTQERLIWVNYNQIYVLMSRQKTPEIYFPCWTSMAEVIHQMVLKYGTNIPEKDLFCMETVEKFHIISCSIQHNESNVDTGKYVKYANFLRAEKKYEEAVKVLMTVCQRPPSNHPLYFSRLTSEVLDLCLRIELALQDEMGHNQNYFIYHLLTGCYIQAGVLSEVCTVENIEDVTPHLINMILYGYQLILSGKQLEAFHCFANISSNYQPFGIKYAAMIYIIARICTHIGQSPTSYQ